MGRGPGKWQVRLLEAVEAARPGGVLAVDVTAPDSDQVAQRRAAYRLRDAGRVQLCTHRDSEGRRLVAYAPGVGIDPDAPPPAAESDMAEVALEAVNELRNQQGRMIVWLAEHHMGPEGRAHLVDALRDILSRVERIDG